MRLGSLPHIAAVVLALARVFEFEQHQPLGGTTSGTTTDGAPVNCGGTLTQTTVSGNTYPHSEHTNSGTVANRVDGGQVQADVATLTRQ